MDTENIDEPDDTEGHTGKKFRSQPIERTQDTEGQMIRGGLKPEGEDAEADDTEGHGSKKHT